MPEPPRTDAGGTDGKVSVSSVSLELMAKDGAGRRIQGIRIMQSKPEDGPESSYGPNKSPKTSPSTIENVIFLMVLDPLSACDSKPEHKHDSQNTINQWYSQDTTKTWS
ncbi:hypothetical protein O181_038805 [Austropuccinia psidii MF-1]|uniref:Uncharacterized protein n=1 Tax=Austropuccinia psidii MF-1 TaxID=1389203 RepID=A0A9Q3HEH8_9BASI|nr:hypothetical protein [Austropuccinia psidii MF-1]